jgi:Kef-type K+ transport system membrane component KefB
MTHARLAPVMGLAMGAMIPAMAHGPMAGAGLAFVLAHVAVIVAAATGALLWPRLRSWAAAHRPSGAMLGRMALGAVAGFALVCTHCLVTWHGTA